MNMIMSSRSNHAVAGTVNHENRGEVRWFVVHNAEKLHPDLLEWVSSLAGMMSAASGSDYFSTNSGTSSSNSDTGASLLLQDEMTLEKKTNPLSGLAKVLKYVRFVLKI